MAHPSEEFKSTVNIARQTFGTTGLKKRCESQIDFGLLDEKNSQPQKKIFSIQKRQGSLACLRDEIEAKKDSFKEVNGVRSFSATRI